MTPNPECATIDTPIVDALHTMHDGKFLHLPVVDRGRQRCMFEFIHSIDTYILNLTLEDGLMQMDLLFQLLMFSTSLMLR